LYFMKEWLSYFFT